LHPVVVIIFLYNCNTVICCPYFCTSRIRYLFPSLEVHSLLSLSLRLVYVLLVVILLSFKQFYGNIYLCQLIYYYSSIVLLVLCLIHLAIHFEAPVQFLFRLCCTIEESVMSKQLHCSENSKGVFFTRSLYLLHYTSTHRLRPSKNL